MGEPENLVLVYLRRLDAKIDRLQEDVQDLKAGQNELARSVAGIRPDQGSDAEIVARQMVRTDRTDRLAERLTRVERRLDLAEEPPAA